MSIPYLPRHRRRPTTGERIRVTVIGIVIVLVCLVVGIGAGVGLGALLLWMGSFA